MALHMGTSKPWLIVKDAQLSDAHAIFQGSGIPITSEDLGAAIGSESFVHSYVSEKVSEWITEIELLSQISLTQPHSAYAAFTHGLSSKWTYLSKTISNIKPLLQPFDAINKSFLPCLTDQNTFSCQLRYLLALLSRLGGLSIIKLVDQSQLIFDHSTRLTRPLVDLILQQSTSLPFEVIEAQSTARYEIHQEQRQSQSIHCHELFTKLPASLQQSMKVACETGASTWLSMLPIQELGFALHKGAFRDALCLRYGW